MDADRRRRGDGYLDHETVSDFFLKVLQELRLINFGTWIILQMRRVHSNVPGNYLNAFSEDASEPDKIFRRGSNGSKEVPPLNQMWQEGRLWWGRRSVAPRRGGLTLRERMTSLLAPSTNVRENTI